MRQGTTEDGAAVGQPTIEGRLIAIELMILALAQRAPEGAAATATALILLGDIERDMRAGGVGGGDTLAVARRTLEKIAGEVIAFRDGEDVLLR